MNKQQTIDLLKQQMPSFYSLEQVIEMISKIEEPKVTFLDEEHIEKIVKHVKRSVESTIRDINFNEYDFDVSINYNKEIELDNVDIDGGDIADSVGNDLEEFLTELKEQFESEDKVEDEMLPL
jgi:hypothetical protein